MKTNSTEKISVIHTASIPFLSKQLFAAASNKGIFFLSFQGPTQGLRSIRKMNPKAVIKKNNPRLKQNLQQTVRALESGKNLPRFPLDLEGTPFQKSVWKSLLKIPAGKTKSYQDIAKSIGKPKAVRAVGTACGQNSVALLVPCHRVIQTGGGLGGYASGLPIKKQLLKLEKSL